MELSVTTSRQLQYLALHHPLLRTYFGGVKASDRMPVYPYLDVPRGYIVNLDRHDQPGSHWIALWTDDGKGEIMDSFALPFWQAYPVPELKTWLTKHLEVLQQNTKTLQAIDAESCGLYALFFLIHKSQGGTMQSFESLFSDRDYVKNDRRVAVWFKDLLKHALDFQDVKPAGQSNTCKTRICCEVH